MSRRPYFPAALVLTVLVLYACSGQEQQTMLAVPASDPPQTEGTMAAGEWDAAERSLFSDGSELFLQCAQGSLYVGIRGAGEEMIAGNVYVSRGERVSIMHTSAALGTAHYQKADEAWERRQDFVWRCRRTDDGKAAQSERERFWESERWLAANSRMGTPNELEYRIELDGKTLRLAAAILRSSGPSNKAGWPAEVADDVITPTPGGMPEQLHLATVTWELLDVSHCGG